MTDERIEERAECVWEYVEYLSGLCIWETECGNSFQFDNDGGPLTNGMKFCPYCGARLNELPEVRIV